MVLGDESPEIVLRCLLELSFLLEGVLDGMGPGSALRFGRSGCTGRDEMEGSGCREKI